MVVSELAKGAGKFSGGRHSMATVLALSMLLSIGGGTGVVSATDGSHYVSINSSDQSEGSNYNNDGATRPDAIAIGLGSSAGSLHSIAIGGGKADRSTTNEDKDHDAGSIAIGYKSQATGYGSIAIGSQDFNVSSGKEETTGATALGDNSIAIGNGAVTGHYSTALGKHAEARGTEAIAIGNDTVATWEYTTALGKNAQALATGAVAIGFGAKATGISAFAATKAEASGQSSSAFGENTKASGDTSTAFGIETQATDTGAVAMGAVTKASGKISTATGNGTEASGTASMAMGNQTKATNRQSVAMGFKTVSSGVSAVAAGSNTESSGEAAIAAGYYSQAKGNYALAQGYYARASGGNSAALAGGITGDDATNAVALGNEAQATLADSVALGTGSVADTASGKVGYDPATGSNSTESSSTWKSTSNAIAVGSVSNGITRQITGLAAGTADTDAVNVAQLKAVAKMIQNGGGDTPAPTPSNISVKDGAPGVDGKDGITRIVYKDAEGKEHQSASLDDGMQYSGDSGEQLQLKLNSNVNIKGGISDEAKLSENNIGVVSDGKNTLRVKLSKDLTGLSSVTATTITGDTIQANTVKAQTVNTQTVTTQTIQVGDKVTINQQGMDMGGTTITNIADGKVAQGSKDVVNGGQLYETQQRIGELGRDIDQLDSRVDRVGAGAAALAALHPQDFDPDDKWDFAAGYGHYRSANAMAIGAFYRPDAKTMFSVGGSMGGGENMLNVGVTLKLGKSSPYAGYSKAALTNVITDQKAQLETQKKENQELKAQVRQQQTQIDDILRQLAAMKKA